MLNNKKKTIILITGYARSGKSTVAELLAQKLDGEYLENANVVKNLATKFFKWDGVKDTIGRELLINITNTGYSYDCYFWEKRTENVIKISEKNYFIISDWRYKNTYLYFSSMDYNIVTIRVNREEVIKNNNIISNSETNLDGYKVDYVLDNTKSMDDLEIEINNLADLIKICHKIS